MSNSAVAPTARPGAGTEPAWHGLDASAVLSALESDRGVGLTAREATARRDRLGPNEIVSEPAPSLWMVAVTQLEDPMNLMLVAVVIVSVVIGEIPTALVVAVLATQMGRIASMLSAVAPSKAYPSPSTAYH